MCEIHSLILQIEEILRLIRKTFEDDLESSDWMDENTIDGAFEKVQAVKQIIGYPDDIKNAVKLDKYYSKVKEHNLP